MKVEDARGNDFFCFPVTDFLPNQVPTSNDHGVMRFHHVSTAVEWDNYGWYLFWLCPIETKSSPAFICRFVHRGREIHRIPYGELPYWDWPGRTWEEVPKVRRRWDWEAMTPAEMLQDSAEPDGEYDSRLRRLFHIDPNDKRQREGVIARRNACRLLGKMTETAKDLEFPVIRRTITIVSLVDD